MSDEEKREAPVHPGLQEIQDYYDDFLEYQKRDRERENPRHSAIKRRLRMLVKPGSDVLDLGCGIGITTEFINRLGASVIGVDLSPKLIEYARETVPGVIFESGDVCRYRSDKKFDLICMVDVLEHIPPERHEELFTTLDALLKEDGTLFVSIPNPRYHEYSLEEQIGTIQIVDEVVDIPKLSATASAHGIVLNRNEPYSVWNLDEYSALTFRRRPPSNADRQSYNKIIYTFLKFPVVTETFIQAEVEYLVEKGYDVEVFSHLPGDDTGTFKYPEIVTYADFQDPATVKLLEERKPTHLHCHFANFAHQLCYPMAVRLGVPFSFTAHAFDLHKEGYSISGADLRDMTMSPLCTGAIVISEYNRDFMLSEGVPAEKIFIIPTSIKIDVIDAIPAGGYEGRYILAVGRLIEMKGFRYLIEAFKLLPEEDLRLIIVGDDKGEGPLLKELAASDKRIFFLGEMGHTETVGLIKDAFMVVTPSVIAADGARDGTPTILVEGMACSKAVVGTEVAGIPYLIRDGENGLIVPPANVEALADAIDRLLFDEELRQRVAANARITAEERSISSTGPLLEPILRDRSPAVRNRAMPAKADMAIDYMVGRYCRGKVLELSCGRGDLTAFLAASGCDVVAADEDEVALRSAMNGFERDCIPGAAFMKWATSQDFTDGYFDIVLLKDSLEWADEPDGLVREALRLAGPDGEVLVSMSDLVEDFQPLMRRQFGQAELQGYLEGLGASGTRFLEGAPEGRMLCVFRAAGKSAGMSVSGMPALMVPRLPELDESEKVSVIVPTFNRADLIEESLDSVLGQTYGNLEVIVVNDGSSDGTAEVLKPYLESITYLEQENAGKSAALNNGLKHATGQYVMVFDDDDIAVQRKVEIQVRYMQKHPEIDFIHGDAYYFDDESGAFIYKWQAADIPQKDVLRTELFGNVFHTPTVICRKSLCDKAGDYDTDLVRAQDYDMWIRCMFAGAMVAAINVPFVHYRQHRKARGTSADSFSAEQVFKRTMEAERKIFAKILKEQPLSGIFPLLKDIKDDRQKKEATAAALAYRASILLARQMTSEAIEDLKNAYAVALSPDVRRDIAGVAEQVVGQAIEAGRMADAERGIAIVHKIDAMKAAELRMRMAGAGPK